MYKHARLLGRRASAVKDTTSKYEYITAFDPFEPTYTCHSEYRRGKSFGDGGKYVCGEDSYFTSREKHCLVYSVGSDGEVSFEADIIRRLGCEVHTFDPTGNSDEIKASVEATGAKFHPIGIGGGSGSMLHNNISSTNVQLKPITDVIEMLGHNGRHISILKIDCEGCEYEALDALWTRLVDGRVSIGQIQIELHMNDFATINRFFEEANNAGYMLFHKERNHWGCSGYLCVEFSLVHKAEAKRIFEHAHC